MLSEIPAAAQIGEGASGSARPPSATTAQTIQTRYRATDGGRPRRTNRRLAQPQRKPPIIAKMGGMGANVLAAAVLRPNTVTRYLVVQLNQMEYGTPFKIFAAAKIHSRESRKGTAAVEGGTAAAFRPTKSH